MSLRDATIDRERRDLVTHQAMDEARLIRFVAGPDGLVAPDLGRKLPGRGMWVEALRTSVDAAVKKNLFSRSAKAPAEADSRPGRYRRIPADPALSGPVGSCPARRCAYLGLREIRRGDPIGQGRLAHRSCRRCLRWSRETPRSCPASDDQGLWRIQCGRFEFGPWAGKCDTLLYCCMAAEPIAGPSRSNDWRDFDRFGLSRGTWIIRARRAGAGRTRTRRTSLNGRNDGRGQASFERRTPHGFLRFRVGKRDDF